MINVYNLSYSFPQKELYHKISFTIQDDTHCALIGSSGTGKSTLLDLLLHPDDYLYDGKIEMDTCDKIGFVSQHGAAEQEEDVTVFQYLNKECATLEQTISDCCKEMETAQDLEDLFQVYQKALDEFDRIDGNHFESNLKKQLHLAGLQKLENRNIHSLSTGEFKLVQVMKQMLFKPGVLLMDEPDVFLDFQHLNGLRNLIHAYKGTLLVSTHNRYLLRHCFQQILHMENRELVCFVGSYMEYTYQQLLSKLELEEAAAQDQAEIERQSRILEKARIKASVMDHASLGKAVHARQSLVDRLKAKKTNAPFLDLFQPHIHFETETNLQEEWLLQLTDYHVAFDEQLLEHVDVQIRPNEKVAIVGNNGTGKTTLLCEIFENKKDSICIASGAKMAMFSPVTDTLYDSSKHVSEILEEKGLEGRAQAIDYLSQYGFSEHTLDQKVCEMSGGEKDLFQLSVLALEKANFLLLDEPTGHLDLNAQIALERALETYQGGVLMISHDFYTVSQTVDYVLLIEEKKLRKLSVRRFRQMIYANYFDKDDLLLEEKKKETEIQILQSIQARDFDRARSLLETLAKVIQEMKGARTGSHD